MKLPPVPPDDISLGAVFCKDRRLPGLHHRGGSASGMTTPYENTDQQLSRLRVAESRL
jgi:hypothetical protein